MEYQLYVNGSLSGSVVTDDIDSYMKSSNYNNTKYQIDISEREVFIHVDILDVMRGLYN